MLVVLHDKDLTHKSVSDSKQQESRKRYSLVACGWLTTTAGRKYIVCMHQLCFLWDDLKNSANEKKHEVAFEEAKSAFLDEYARVYFDPDHSHDEDRFLLLGMSARQRILVVSHCFRESETLIRIISARKANKHEQHDYWSRRK